MQEFWRMKSPIFDVSLVHQAVPQKVAKAAYGVFRELQIKPGSLYLVKNESEFSSSKLSQYDDAIIAFINRHCLFLDTIAQNLGIKSFHGFEIWTNLADECSERVVVHVDNDEGHRARTGEVLNPVFGSILYLGPKYLEEGGGTCFFLDTDRISAHPDFLFCSRVWERVAATYGHTSLQIPFNVGDMVVFRGDLPHCVIPFKKSELGPRVAFLANAWNHPLASELL